MINAWDDIKSSLLFFSLVLGLLSACVAYFGKFISLCFFFHLIPVHRLQRDKMPRQDFGRIAVSKPFTSTPRV